MEITRGKWILSIELKLKGKMDGSTAESVGEAISQVIDEGAHVVTLDMSELRYLSSAGLRIVMLYHKQLLLNGGRIQISNPSEPARMVLDLSGLGGFVIKE